MTSAPTPPSDSVTPGFLREKPTYELALEPDGSSWTVRENLTDILERELLGPVDGPEELMETRPDILYLVGRIAPVRLTHGKADPQSADAEEQTDVGDAVDAAEGRGVPLTAVDDGAAEGDEDTVEDEPQKRGLMIPASMGLRFQIPFECEAFTVNASWGVYNAEATGEVTKAGRSIRRYRRTPIDIPIQISVSDLDAQGTTAIPLRDDVVVRVDRFDDQAGGRRLIEIALCNDRETPRKIPVNAWLFQTKLYVEAGGEPVFLPVQDVVEDDRFEPDDEVRRLNLQYRDRLEFAIGRTCSATWAVAEGARRASKVWTTWLPTSETPQIRAEEIAAATLDMPVLATATAEQVRAGLSPIVEGYATWLQGQKATAQGLPEHLRAEALDAVTEATKVLRQLEEGLDYLAGDVEALRCFHFMNRVMADQRVQSQVAQLRAQQPRVTIAEARAQVLARGPVAHSWRTFQLAFILLQIPAMCRPDLPRRSGDLAKVQLLFFPTGGGKTEAYLGLAAFTFAIRRRQGVIDSPDGSLDGGPA